MSRLDRAAVFSCLFGIGVALAVGVPAVASFGIIIGAVVFLIEPKPDPSPPPARGRDTNSGGTP